MFLKRVGLSMVAAAALHDVAGAQGAGGSTADIFGYRPGDAVVRAQREAADRQAAEARRAAEEQSSRAAQQRQQMRDTANMLHLQSSLQEMQRRNAAYSRRSMPGYRPPPAYAVGSAAASQRQRPGYAPLNCGQIVAGGVRNACSRKVELHWCGMDEPCDLNRPRNMWAVGPGQTYPTKARFVTACEPGHGFRDGVCRP